MRSVSQAKSTLQRIDLNTDEARAAPPCETFDSPRRVESLRESLRDSMLRPKMEEASTCPLHGSCKTVEGGAKAEACAKAARVASQVTTLAGNPTAKGCVDGDGQAALMNETVAVAVSPDGRRVPPHPLVLSGHVASLTPY